MAEEPPIVELKPLTLNLTLGTNKKTKSHKIELRMSKDIKDIPDKLFWMDFFEAVLTDVPIKAEVLIKTKDKFERATQLKKMGLLKPGIKIKY